MNKTLEQHILEHGMTVRGFAKLSGIKPSWIYRNGKSRSTAHMFLTHETADKIRELTGRIWGKVLEPSDYLDI